MNNIDVKVKPVLIFDFDGTFYTGRDIFCNLEAFMDRHRRGVLKSITNNQYKQIQKEFPEWDDIHVGATLVKYIYLFKKKYPNFKITIKDYLKWQNTHLEPVNLKGAKFVDLKFLKNLCNNYRVYVVSNSCKKHILYYMKKIGINPKWFVKIISNKFTAKDKTKMHYYKKILDDECCKPYNAYVFGDSVNNDLVPAINLGINTYYINDAEEINLFVEDILKKYQKN